MSTYTTGEVAKLCGVSVRTVQYYDTRGILIPTELSEGGRRLYSEDALAKMKIICFLRELDLPLDGIAKLLQEGNSQEIISMILSEQEALLRDEISEKQRKLDTMEALRHSLQKTSDFSLDAIGDVAHVMKNKKELRRVRRNMILTAIPLEILEIGAVIVWAAFGLWIPFVCLYLPAAVLYSILLSRYYFKSISYICPSCHEVFNPRFKEAFWSSHTITSRKLTCPHCKQKSFCVETYRSV